VYTPPSQSSPCKPQVFKSFGILGFRTSRLAGRSRNVAGFASPVQSTSFFWTTPPAKHVLPDICQTLTRQVRLIVWDPTDYLWLVGWLVDWLVGWLVGRSVSWSVGLFVSWILYKSGKVCLRRHDQLKYRKSFFKTDRKLLIRHWWQSNFFRDYFKNCFLTKEVKLRIDSAASSGGERKLRYFIYFPWFPFEVGQSNSTFSLLMKRGKQLSSHIYTFLFDSLCSERNCPA